jgi:hypothetical protein
VRFAIYPPTLDLLVAAFAMGLYALDLDAFWLNGAERK